MAFDFSVFMILIAALLRSLAGWFENSLEDGKIQRYEWVNLGLPY